MDPATIGYLACAVVIFLLAIRVPIAYAIGGVAVVAIFLVFATRTGSFMPERPLRHETAGAGVLDHAETVFFVQL